MEANSRLDTLDIRLDKSGSKHDMIYSRLNTSHSKCNKLNHKQDTFNASDWTNYTIIMIYWTVDLIPHTIYRINRTEERVIHT